MCIKLCDVTTLEKVTETCFPVSKEPTKQRGERAHEHLSKHTMKTEKLHSERRKPWVSVYFDMGMDCGSLPRPWMYGTIGKATTHKDQAQDG